MQYEVKGNYGEEDLVKNNLFVPLANSKVNFWWFGVCVVLFSGIVISDVLYGLVLLCFCIFFTYQKNKSTKWTYNIKLLLPISIIGTLLGIVSGNFASNFLPFIDPIKKV